jgi:hypothetical protein
MTEEYNVEVLQTLVHGNVKKNHMLLRYETTQIKLSYIILCYFLQIRTKQYGSSFNMVSCLNIITSRTIIKNILYPSLFHDTVVFNFRTGSLITGLIMFR